MVGVRYKKCSWTWCSKIIEPWPIWRYWPMLEEDCNDIPVIHSSAILWAVSYIPTYHEIGSSNDDDDDDHDSEKWIDEQNERNVFTIFLVKKALLLFILYQLRKNTMKF